jgi:hypothetical protein
MIGIDPLTGRYSLWPGDEAAQLNVFHRYMAFLIAVVVIFCAVRCWMLLSGQLDLKNRILVWLPVFLVLLQILVGVTMLAMWNLKIYPNLAITDHGANLVQVTMRTLHLAIGTLLLISLWLQAVMAGQAARARELAGAPEVKTAGTTGGTPQPA